MSVLLVVLSGFFLFGGSMMYASIMPVQVAELGAPAWVPTAIPMALPSIVAIILLLPIAVYADSTGKRREILLTVSILICLANIGLAQFTESWVAVTILRIITGIPNAILPMLAVILTFILPEEKRGAAMGLGMGGAMLGMGVFQALSGSLFGWLGSYSNLYYFAALLSAIAFLLLLPVKVPAVKSPTTLSGKDIAGVMKNRNIFITGTALFFYLIGWNIMFGSFPVVSTDVLNTPIQLQTALFAVASVMLGFGTFIWGPVVDKIGGKKTLLTGITLSALASFAIIPLSIQLWPYVILFWIATLGGVCGSPASSVIATRSVPKEMSTVAVNAMFIFVTLAGIVGGFIAGPIMAAGGLVVMLLVAAILQAFGDLLALKVPSKIEQVDQSVAG